MYLFILDFFNDAFNRSNYIATSCWMEAHIILLSVKKPRDIPARCALCNGDHPANCKGCEYYHSLIRPNNANNRLNIQKRIQNPNAPPRIEDKTTWQHQQYYHQNLQHNHKTQATQTWSKRDQTTP
jgi:hypothetical protein